MQELFSRHTIAVRVWDLSRLIIQYYQAKGSPGPIMLPVMSGAIMFAADLARAIEARSGWDSSPNIQDIIPVRARSYVGGVSSGAVALDLPPDLRSEDDILIVDDIYDTGRTLNALVTTLQRTVNPDKIKSVVLLDKPARREIVTPGHPTWVGMQIENHFVVGYGMDFNGRFRALPNIYRTGAEAERAA